jgi:hypothetical protein
MAVDWVHGKIVAGMLRAILNAEGEHITRIAGYVTDKLGATSEQALRRFASRVALQLGDECKVSLETIEGRRYLVFRK